MHSRGLVMQFNFELISPEKKVFEGKVEMVVIPGVEGDFGVMYNHTPIISFLRPGVLEIHNNNNNISRIFVSNGFVEVTSDNCTVIAENIKSVEEIDIEECEKTLSNLKSHSNVLDLDIERKIEVMESMIEFKRN